MIKFRAKAAGGWHVDQPLELMKFPAGEIHIKTPNDDEIYSSTIELIEPAIPAS